MGIVIQTGGGAGQLGGGFGAGFSKGMGKGLDQAHEAALRQQELDLQKEDANQLVAALETRFDMGVESEADKVPDMVADPNSMVQTNLPRLGGVPFAPIPTDQYENPDELKIRRIQEDGHKLLQSLSDNPEAAGVVAGALDERLGALSDQRAHVVLERSVEASVNAGLLGPEDAKKYAEAIDAGHTASEVLDAWNTDREDLVARAKVMKRKQSSLERIASISAKGSLELSAAIQAATEQPSADPQGDSDNLRWMNEKQTRMAEIADDARFDLETNPEGYNAGAWLEKMREVEYALNPYQQARVAAEAKAQQVQQSQDDKMELERFRQKATAIAGKIKGLSASLGSATGADAIAKIQDLLGGATKEMNDLFGLSGQAEPSKNDPVAIGVPGGGGDQQGPTEKGSDTPKYKAQRSLVQAYEPFRGDHFGEAATVEDVDTQLDGIIRAAADVLGIKPGGAPKVMANRLARAVKRLERDAPEDAATFMGQLSRVIQEAEARKQAILSPPVEPEMTGFDAFRQGAVM